MDLVRLLVTDSEKTVLIGIGTRQGVVLIRGQVEQIITASIVPYAQTDPRWQAFQIAPGYLMGRYGCYITCIAMFLPLAGYWDTPPEVSERLRAVGALSGALVARPERISLAYPGVSFVARYDWRDVPADTDAIREHWQSGHQVLLEVEFTPGGARPPEDQHFVLLYQYEDNPYIVDPHDGQVKRLLPRYGLPGWDARRAIYGARIFSVGGAQ